MRELTTMEMECVAAGTGGDGCSNGPQAGAGDTSTSANEAAGGTVAAANKASTDNANKVIDAVLDFFGL